jgi:kanosamine 6-kinase
MALLGIDIGGTKVAVRLRTSNGGGGHGESRGAGDPGGDGDGDRGRAGDVDLVMRWATGAGAAEDLAALASLVAEAIGKADVPVSRAGVSVAATLSADGAVTAWPGRPSWVGAGLGDALREMLGVPFRTGDDGTLAALAEAWDAGCTDFAYIGVGTGVGGGLVFGGRLHAGAYGGAGELGHVVVDPAGPRCACGRRGCLQAVASGPATIARASGDGGASGALAPEEFVAAVRRGDSSALGALQASADALALAVVTLAETVQPALVRIGGGFSAAVPELVPMVADAVRLLQRPGHTLPQVAPAAFGPYSSLEGALLIAQQDAGSYHFTSISL